MESITTYLDSDRHYYLAYWFDSLARHLLHRESVSFEEWKSGKNGEHFDFQDPYLRSYVEIKGSSNMDQFKIFKDQLDAQVEEIGFPVDMGFMWIFSYSNRKGGKGRRLLKRKSGKSSESLSAFLASHTDTAYVVDIRLIEALCKKNGTHRYSRDTDRKRHLVNTDRTELKRIADDPKSSFAELGLADDIPRWLPPNAKRIRPRFIETTINGNEVRFKLILLLPNGLKTRFLKRLNGTVKRIPV